MCWAAGIAAVKKLAAQAAELSKADAAYDAAQAALRQPNATTAVVPTLVTQPLMISSDLAVVFISCWQVHQACATNQKASPFAGQTNKISFAQPVASDHRHACCDMLVVLGLLFRLGQTIFSSTSKGETISV